MHDQIWHGQRSSLDFCTVVVEVETVLAGGNDAGQLCDRSSGQREVLYLLLL